MKLHWVPFSLFFAFQIFFLGYSFSQTNLILASSKSGEPIQYPPDDSLLDDLHSPIDYNYYPGNDFITNCYDEDSVSGNAIVRVEFELNSLLLPSLNQPWQNYNYALKMFAYDINGNSLPIISVSDSMNINSTINQAYPYLAGTWYPIVHWDSALGGWRGLAVIEVDDSNNILGSGYLSIDFEVGYLLTNNPASSSVNSFLPIGIPEKVMAGMLCQYQNGYNPLRKPQESKYSFEIPLSLHPNPAIDYFNIVSRFQKDGPLGVKIYDLKGKEFFRKIIEPVYYNGEWSFSVKGIDHFKKGIYLVEARIGTQVEYLKLIIQ